jgi:hypothetical protein
MQWTDGLPDTCWANIPLRRSLAHIELTRLERKQTKYQIYQGRYNDRENFLTGISITLRGAWRALGVGRESI